MKKAFAAALAALVCVAAWLWVRRADPVARRRSLPILALALIASVLPVILALVGLDFYAYRYLPAVWVLIAVVGSVGLTAEESRIALPASVGLVAVFLAITIAVNLDPSLQRSDWRFAPTALGRPPTTRLIVVTPFYDEGVLRIYVSATQLLRKGRARVNEIDLVGYRLRPRAKPPSFDHRFEVVSVISHQKLSFVRYRAATPTTVELLRVPGLETGTRAFIIQRAP